MMEDLMKMLEGAGMGALLRRAGLKTIMDKINAQTPYSAVPGKLLSLKCNNEERIIDVTIQLSFDEECYRNNKEALAGYVDDIVGVIL